MIITDNARLQIKKNLAQSHAKAIRLNVKKAGCSGYMYYLDLAQDILTNDVRLEDDLPIIYDVSVASMFDGVTLDYIQEGLNKSFKFSNSNAKGECGCGQSFVL